MIAGILFGFVPLAVWLYLLLFRSGFWLLRERDTAPVDQPASWPSVVAVVPARNEADVIAHSIGSLLAQDYPGPFHVVLVDDQSDDGTGPLARRLSSDRLTVLTGGSRPLGWTGKLWAMKQGSDYAAAFASEFLWFTDADIVHAADNLRQLVARAQSGDKVLVSLMARLSCKSLAEHFLIPAFVFFFDMLFPFAAVNNPRSKIAAAAGGCMLVRRPALEKAGGLAAIRHNIIDDCALVTRTAYAQLGYSPLVLAATLFGLAMVYLAPVMTALFAWGISQMAGWLAWIIMAAMYQPILRFYRLSPLWGLALPLIGIFYAGFTCQSAILYWSGKGGMWKGRAQADAKQAEEQA
jgi:cellulose synthase/poly-beta-1,6-N-acetylglucosamine synthase-like glycosyltransferase